MTYFLKTLELDKADEAELEGREYSYILEPEFRWGAWAMPKDDEGKLDHHVALTGKDLVEFVDTKLFPYMASFKERTDDAQTIEYKIGEIFSELKNKIQSGYGLREILTLTDSLPFRSHTDKHGKTNPLNDKDLAEFVELQASTTSTSSVNGSATEGPETERSWNVSVSELAEDTYDLSVKNPNTPEEAPLRSPSEILDEMKVLDDETREILDVVRGLI